MYVFYSEIEFEPSFRRFSAQIFIIFIQTYSAHARISKSETAIFSQCLQGRTYNAKPKGYGNWNAVTVECCCCQETRRLENWRKLYQV
jgi:hypothetical protein